MTIYAFDDFELDEARWELRRGGSVVEVPPKVMALLSALVTNRDRVVTNEELFESVWPGVRVTEASVTKAVRIARQLLGDDGASQRVIRTLRGRGYRFVAGVTSRPAASASPSEAPRERLSTGSAPIGRMAELSALEAAFEQCCGGRGSLLVISGEAGIGKTHLLETFARHVVGDRARTLWGSTCEEGGAPELWPWIQVLRGLRDAGLFDALDPIAREALRILPENVGREASSTTATLSGDAARFRTFDAIGRALRRAARSLPLVLLLEDLHGTDRESLRLLRFLARDLRDAPILVVATHRPVEDLVGLPGERLVENLALDGPSIVLGRLDVEETHALVRAGLTDGVSPALLERIHERTEGNPFFVAEIVRWLAMRRSFHEPLDGLELPRGIVEAVLARLGTLPGPTRDTLATAAVIGQNFELALLASVVGATAREVTGVLEPALARRIITRTGTSGAYGFSHILLRDVLYATLQTAHRADLHRQVGEALEASSAPGAEPAPAILAHHHFKAALGAPSERAALHCLTAGRHALGQLALEEARRHFDNALAALRFASGTEHLRADVLAGMGSVCRLDGDYAGARDAFLTSLGIGRALNDPVRVARAALGFAQVRLESGAPNDDVVQMLRESAERLETLPEPRSEEARDALSQVLSRLALSHSVTGEPDLGDALSARALSIAHDLDQPATRAQALIARHWALWRPGTARERLALAEEIIGIDRLMRDPQIALLGRAAQITDLLELGRSEAFGRCLLEYERIADETRDPLARWNVRVFHTTRALLEGRFEEAERQAMETLPIGAAIHAENAALFHAAQLWCTRVEQGRGAEIEAPFREMVNGQPSDRSARGALLRLYTELGDRVETRRQLELLGPEDSLCDWQLLPTLAHAAMACHLLGDAAKAARIHQCLLPYDGTHVVIGPAIVYAGPVSLYLGVCEHTLGHPEEAMRRLHDARRAATTLGAHAVSVRIDVHRAKATADAGDLTTARRLAEESAVTARALGMRVLADRAMALLQA